MCTCLNVRTVLKTNSRDEISLQLKAPFIFVIMARKYLVLEIFPNLQKRMNLFPVTSLYFGRITPIQCVFFKFFIYNIASATLYKLAIYKVKQEPNHSEEEIAYLQEPTCHGIQMVAQSMLRTHDELQFFTEIK